MQDNPISKPPGLSWHDYVQQMWRTTRRPLLTTHAMGVLELYAQYADTEPCELNMKALSTLIRKHGLTRTPGDPNHQAILDRYPLTPDEWIAFLSAHRLDVGRYKTVVKDTLAARGLKYGYYRTWKCGRAGTSTLIRSVILPLMYIHGYTFDKPLTGILEAETPPINTSLELTCATTSFRKTMADHPEGRAFIIDTLAARSLQDDAYAALYAQPYPLSEHDLQAVFDNNQFWGLAQNMFWSTCRLSLSLGHRMTRGETPISPKSYSRIMPVLWLHGYDFNARRRIKRFKPGVPVIYLSC